MKKIKIIQGKKSHLIEIHRIVRFEACGNRTHVFLAEGDQIHSTCTLKHYHNRLHGNGFFRIHDKHLVNVDYVEVYSKGNPSNVKLKCKTELPVSFRRKAGYNIFMGNHAAKHLIQ